MIVVKSRQCDGQAVTEERSSGPGNTNVLGKSCWKGGQADAAT